jgi:hypothetical protein
VAIRLFGEDRAFYLNDLEGPVQKPLLRITRKGVGGQKAYIDDPVSIVYYGPKTVPVLTPGRRLTKTQEASFNEGFSSLLPAVARKVLGVASHFQPFAGRITVTRDWASPRGIRKPPGEWF